MRLFQTSHCLLCFEALHHDQLGPEKSGATQPASHSPPPSTVARYPGLCYACHQRLPWHHVSEDTDCLLETESPQHHRPPLLRSMSAFHYRFPIDHIIQTFKFQKKLHYRDLLSHYLVEQIRQTQIHTIDGIIPVPLHAKRLRNRGYNQSYWLAKSVGQYLKLPVWDHCCQRIKNTQSQSSLPASQRTQNVVSAFRLTKQLPTTMPHVAIVDDVLTTGATVNALAQTLLSTGVSSISVWSIAKADH